MGYTRDRSPKLARSSDFDKLLHSSSLTSHTGTRPAIFMLCRLLAPADSNSIALRDKGQAKLALSGTTG